MEENILKMLEEGKSLIEIGEVIGKSKSTAQRIVSKMGYYYNKDLKKYCTFDNNEQEQNNNDTNVLRGTMKQCNDITVQRTYVIDKKMEKALKIKSAVEEKDVSQIVREALEKYIEEKYYKF